MDFITIIQIGAVLLVIFTAAFAAYTVKVKRKQVPGYALWEIGGLIGLICLLPFIGFFHESFPEDEDSPQGRIFNFVIFIILVGISAAYLWMIRPRK